MNKIYKVVWSKVKNCYVVVSELAKNIITGGVKSAKVGSAPMAKGLALGAAMAFVITGNAWAAELVDKDYTSANGTNVNKVVASGHANGNIVGVTGDNETVTVNNSAFEGNSLKANSGQARGGVIYTQGDVEVTGSSFVNNKVTASSNAYGGAIAQQDGELTIDGTVFEANVAGYRGAAIHTANSTVTISGSEFKNHAKADGSWFTGGVVYLQNGTNATMSGNVFEGNNAASVLVDGSQLIFEGENAFLNNASNSIITAKTNGGTVIFAEGSNTLFKGNGSQDFGAMDAKGKFVLETGANVVAESGIAMEAGTLELDGGNLELGFLSKDKADGSKSYYLSKIGTLTGEGGTIAIDAAWFDVTKYKGLTIANNQSTGTVIKARDLDLKGGAAQALKNVVDDLKNEVDNKGNALVFAAAAVDSVLRGDVELTSAGKVITTMDTDDLVIKGDVSANNLYTKGEIDAYRENLEDKLTDAKQQVIDKFADVEGNIEANAGAIAAEQTRAEAAEADLQKGVDANTNAIKANSAAIEGLQTDVAQNTTDIASLEGKTDKMQGDLSKLNGAVEEGFKKFNEEFEKTNTSVSELGTNLTKLNDELVATNEHVVQNIKDINALETKTDNIQADLTKLNSEVENTNAAVNEVAKGLDAVNQEIQKTNEHFNNELGKTNEQVVANAKDIAALENKTDKIQSDLTNLNQEVVKTNEELQKTNANVSALNEELVKTNEHFNNELGKTNEQVVANAKDIAALESKTDNIQTDLSNLNGEVVKTNEELQKTNANVSALNEELVKTNEHFNSELGKTNEQVVANAQAIADEASRAQAAEQRLDNRIDKVDAKIDKVGAMAAAMASLRTMGYDPEAPTEIAVGIGQYRNETGIAIGAFHYPNKDFMLNFSLSTAGDEVMGGVGATWKIGRKKPAGETIEDKVAKAEAMKEAAKAARVKAQQARHAKMLAEK